AGAVPTLSKRDAAFPRLSEIETPFGLSGVAYMKVMVTGGAGFIGSAVCRHLIHDTEHAVVNVDKLTYSANLASLADIEDSPRYTFAHADICDGRRMLAVMEEHAVDAVLHLAAESHVDRSIDGPSPFIETNIVGTYRLL